MNGITHVSENDQNSERLNEENQTNEVAELLPQSRSRNLTVVSSNHSDVSDFITIRNSNPRLERTLTSLSNDFTSKTWFSKAADGDVGYFLRLWDRAKQDAKFLREIQNSWLDNKSLLHISVQQKHIELCTILVEKFSFGIIKS